MKSMKSAKLITFALALGISSVIGTAVIPAASQAAVVHTAMMDRVNKMGTFDKLLSRTSFKMSVGMKSFIVKTSAMTHVTLGSKAVKLSSLKMGDSVTVKGELEMGTIIATSVVVGM
jgi:hypothetical protein